MTEAGPFVVPVIQPWQQFWTVGALQTFSNQGGWVWNGVASANWWGQTAFSGFLISPGFGATAPGGGGVGAGLDLSGIELDPVPNNPGPNNGPPVLDLPGVNGNG